MGSRLWAPILRDALFLSHFQPHEVYKHPDSSQIIQSSTCLRLDNTSPRLVSTFTSTAASGCSIPRRRGRSSVTLLIPPRGLKTFTCKVTQDVLASAPLTFTRKSTAHPRSCFPNALLTFTRKSTALPRLCLPIVIFDFHSQVNTNVLSKSTPKNVLPKCTVKFISKASSLLTSSHLGQACHCGTSLFMVKYYRSCEHDTATLPRVLCVERPLWAGL